MKRFWIISALILAGLASSVQAQESGYWVPYYSEVEGREMECWTPSRESRKCLYPRPRGTTAKTVVKVVQVPVEGYGTRTLRMVEDSEYVRRQLERQRAEQQARAQYDRTYPLREEPLYNYERNRHRSSRVEVYPRYGTWVPGVRITRTWEDNRYEQRSNDRDGRLRSRIDPNRSRSYSNDYYYRTYDYYSRPYDYYYYYRPW